MAERRRAGQLIISLDFELMWGMFDKVTNRSYGANLDGVHVIIPRLLSLFCERQIHATWATVGMLMHESKAALAAALPEKSLQPAYADPALSAYRHLESAAVDAYPKHYFAPALVQKIIATPGQELASHTFSHYYCREEQVVSGEKSSAFFAADCQAFEKAAAPFGISVSSIVFPRNQWGEVALQALREYGITTFRGTEAHVLYAARTDRAQRNPLIRMLRLVDHYLNVSGHHTYPLDGTRRYNEHFINLPASRFLRPWSRRLRLLEPLRLRRIKNSMTHAAKNGEVFHLWWHPHNFGTNQDENFQTLTSLLNHFETLRKNYGMESCSMAEATTRVGESLEPTP